MKYVFKIVLFLALAFKGPFLHSQTFNFRNFNTEQGLPQSQVLCIYQDKKGYIWFGTNNGGAARYDGKHFRVFNTSSGLIDNNVFDVLEDEKGNILFATSKGLSVYNGSVFKNYNEKDGIKNPLIYCLAKDKNNVWLGTGEGVYTLNDGKIKAFKKDDRLNKNLIYSILADSKGKIWFGTVQDDIISYDSGTDKISNFKVHANQDYNLITSLREMQNGDILACSQDGLFRIRNEKAEAVTEIPGARDVAFVELLDNGNGELYYGTQNEGLKLFSFKTGSRLASYKKENGFTNAPVTALLKDREGNLWIGTDGSGVYKYFNDKFLYYNTSSGLDENYVTAVNVEETGKIWLGLKNAGLVTLSGEKIEKHIFDVNKRDALPDNNISALLGLGKDNMLIGTANGLCEYRNGIFKANKDPLLFQKYISCLYKDKANTVWVGTYDGLFRIRNGQAETIAALQSFVLEGRQFPVYFITEDNNGVIWIGSDNVIYAIDGNKVISFKDPANETGYFYSAYVDERNNLWLGAEGGLFMFREGKFTSMTKEFHYPKAFINFLLSDGKGKLYVGTNNGVDIIHLKAYYSNKWICKHLGKDDGLLNLESNFNAAAIDKRGRALIGTIAGLEIYNPSLDIMNSREANVMISSVSLFYGQEDIQKYAGGLDTLSALPLQTQLPYNKNNLTFNFIGISHLAPEKVMYKYKLEGLDKEWTPALKETEITYPSIPPGNYTFMVQAMNNDGIWNKQPAAFVFEIQPPWYRTWWFYLLVAFSLLMGVISYNQYRTRKLTRDKLRLERVVDLRTRELREEKEKVERINHEVLAQKQEIEHKNTEITDSIKYAKNIQEALLPALNEVERAFQNCFVLYLPKDIVSGDFFWYAKKDNDLFIAAADCTGHGVPGAFMSIVGNSLLHEIVNERGLSTPGDILLELHKSLKTALNKNHTESERRDGMDIALCRLNTVSNVIDYAGANRPLWIFRKDMAECDVIKPTKFPIGGLELEEARIYTNHTIPLGKGDSFYIFSDGFADQFGGPKGKKFMVSNMQKLIANNISLSMPEQKIRLKASFDSWKQAIEQVDDVLVIGIRV